MECTPNESYTVSYSSFRTPEELSSAFENFASVADQTNLDCATGQSARGEYTVNGTRAGEVACYVEEGTSTSTTNAPSESTAIASSPSTRAEPHGCVLVSIRP